MTASRGQKEFGHQKRAWRLHRDHSIDYIDQSSTMIEHLQNVDFNKFPEDFLDDSMPMITSRRPETSTILQPYEIYSDIDVMLVDPREKKKKGVTRRNVSSPCSQDSDQEMDSNSQEEEIRVDWAIARRKENTTPLQRPAANQDQAPPNKLSPIAEAQVSLQRLHLPTENIAQNQTEIIAEKRTTPLAEKVENGIQNTNQKSPRVRQLSAVSSTSSGKASLPSSPRPFNPDDPLSAAIDENMPINTAEVCEYIKSELKRLKIQQSMFAERILGRTQGTLSDLLRNPKPWEEMRSGREPFVRMLNWSTLTTERKRELLGIDENGDELPTFVKPLTPKRSSNGVAPATKKRRIIFTSKQKAALDAMFEITREPTKEQQLDLAKKLKLEVKSIMNYFTNARRRKRYQSMRNGVKLEVEDYVEEPM